MRQPRAAKCKPARARSPTVGGTTTIQQTSPTLTLGWRSFNVAPNETVNFVQPSAIALAVNPSRHQRQPDSGVNANGQVFLVNANGVLFAPTRSRCRRAGGHHAGHECRLRAGNPALRRRGPRQVLNQGVTGERGRLVALMANRAHNQGMISARRGTVALGAGSAVTLTSTPTACSTCRWSAALATWRRTGAMQADGGRVVLAAGAGGDPGQRGQQQRRHRSPTVNRNGVIGS